MQHDPKQGPLEKESLLAMSVMVLLAFYMVFFVNEKSKQEVSQFILETKGYMAKESKLLDQAQADLSKAIRATTELHGKVHVERTHSGLTLNIESYRLFSLGQTELRTRAERPISVLAQILRDNAVENDLFLLVEGHTDDSPVLQGAEAFATNWELSAIRAGTVVRLLKDSGVPAERLALAGYGASRPKYPNLNEDGKPIYGNRDLNRRVVIHLMGRRWFEEFLVSVRRPAGI